MTALVILLAVAVVVLMLIVAMLVRAVEDYQRWQREDMSTRIVPKPRRSPICICGHIEAIHLSQVAATLAGTMSCTARSCDCLGFIERDT